MTTDQPTDQTTDTDTDTDTLAALWNDAEVTFGDSPIPADLRARLTTAHRLFQTEPNTTKVARRFPTFEEADEFAGRVKQFSRETGHRSIVKLNGNVVTFRFSKPQPSKVTNPVTVTKIAA